MIPWGVKIFKSPGVESGLGILPLLKNILFVRLFIYLRERERECKQAGGGAEREGGRISSGLPTELRAQLGARSHNPEIMT